MANFRCHDRKVIVFVSAGFCIFKCSDQGAFSLHICVLASLRAHLSNKEWPRPCPVQSREERLQYRYESNETLRQSNQEKTEVWPMIKASYASRSTNDRDEAKALQYPPHPLQPQLAQMRRVNCIRLQLQPIRRVSCIPCHPLPVPLMKPTTRVLS